MTTLLPGFKKSNANFPILTRILIALIISIPFMATAHSQKLGNENKSDTVNIDWLLGSWGVTFPVSGGTGLDGAVADGYDYLSGAQELVDELPTVDYVITNLSYFAHSHVFPMRANTNVDVANEIHPNLVPSAANGEIIFDVLQIFKNSGKKIILYISSNYLNEAPAEIKASWIAYYTNNFGGDEYLAYRDLIQGFVESVKDYADGYWFDTTSELMDDGNYDDFVEMFRAADPTALMSGGGSYLEVDSALVYVDSDGYDDPDPIDYKIFLNTPTGNEDFTRGHVTPLATGAPPNSWAYEEFTIPDMIAEPVVEKDGKQVVKHAWFPIRKRWHVPRQPIVFGTEDAYRFVRRITDAGAAMAFATTIDYYANKGHLMPDEMAILKEINKRLKMEPMADYIPYTRPPGAHLVGENILYPDSLYAFLNPGNTWYHNYCTAEFNAPVLNTMGGSFTYSARIPSTGTYPSPVVSKFIRDAESQAYIEFKMPDNENLTKMNNALFKVRVYTESNNSPGNNSLQLSLRKDHIESTELSLKQEITEYDKWVEYTFDMSDLSMKEDYYNNFYLFFTSSGIGTETDSRVYYFDAFQGPAKQYKVTFKIKDQKTELPLENISVEVDRLVQKTEANGETQFSLASRSYTIKISHPDYGEIVSSLEVSKDTILDFSLTEYAKTVTFELYSETTGNPLPNIAVTLGDNELITGMSGIVAFNLYRGEYSYSISNADYFPNNSSFELTSDTTIRVSLVSKTADIKFRVYFEDSPVYNAVVKIEGDSLITNQTGIAFFSELVRFEAYEWSVSKEGLEDISGVINLTNDSTVNVVMMLTSIPEGYETKSLRLYPNPAHSFINIDSEEKLQQIEIYDLLGALLKSYNVNNTQTAIDISGYPNGLYIISVDRDGQKTENLKLIKN